ncbi:MAG TPA: FKBP-type peptidyl-prolyl cis-trans isomerase [Flavisolibacter sp.]|jgi:FKBP-type peptidyl-prolyl cis-trans isomerase FkpA|nr:FKBP-type peptidyl-prolyl cis-trans isomerase [Flavisolibacter sp.]
MKKLLFAFFVIASLTGCLKGGETGFTCNYDACGFVAPAAEQKLVTDYLTANGLTATQHCSGLYYIIDEAGTGSTPTVCNQIAFSYTGRLTNGHVFDQASTPVVYPLAQLITGFKNGIPLIKTGGKIRLFVPPSLGYGSSQTGDIPPNSVLIFEVTLAGVQ